MSQIHRNMLTSSESIAKQLEQWDAQQAERAKKSKEKKTSDVFAASYKPDMSVNSWENEDSRYLSMIQTSASVAYEKRKAKAPLDLVGEEYRKAQEQLNHREPSAMKPFPGNWGN